MKLLEQLQVAWAKRQPRERVFLTVLAAFLVLALLGQGLWSARSESIRLRKQVPQLRMQAETMQRQAAEIKQVQAQAKTGNASLEGNALLAAANTAAKAGGLAVTPAQLQLEGPRQIRLRASLPFDQWLDWLAAAQAELRLRPVHCQIEGTESPGVVKVDALLALPEPL